MSNEQNQTKTAEGCKDQDCYTCFFKFAGDAKNVDGWCAKYEARRKPCDDYKNDIVINGIAHHFIDPLTEPCLDKCGS